MDILMSDGSVELFFSLYRVQLALAVISLFINVMICIYAFSGDAFSPHTAMFRTLVLIDVFSGLGYILDAFAALLHQEPMLKEQVGTEAAFHEFITVSDCSIYRPYLFLLLISRQWSSVIILIMGFERFLFVTYPLWFKSIRVRRGPIIVFTLMFATMSASVGYINSLFVAPEEMAHFSCELTWAFGDNYGFFQSFFITVPQVLGFLFNTYASWFVSRDTALLKFGNNRTKLNGERRKIRKAKCILTTTVICGCFPQVGLIVLRFVSRWQFETIKLLVSQLFLVKCVGNIFMYRIMARKGRGIIYAAKLWMKKRSKRRVDPNESVTSISYVVG
ncbi:hypothetical protein DdX_03056 [Ditylenchus destructor]|uniref:G-protein coupled receptors family 1 profile domain-containing protein n=1 Tax=Ditylenchus destructor TaxID=166010 RepID=A0AAD4NII4_9BILA|nr:hypothetical protein DdX_03056 [Ditylenchus destructor]